MPKMYNQPHPGVLVRATLIEGANLTVTEAAKRLGVTRVALSKLVNCRSGLSPEIALRLSIALNTSSDMWLNLQKNYDLWHIEKSRNKIRQQVSKVKAVKTAHFKLNIKATKVKK